MAKYKAMLTLEERFWQKVDKDSSTTGCWLWTSKLNTSGYGVIGYQAEPGKRKYLPAHRLSYEIHVGPVPEGLELDHLCRVRRCVNPLHLEPVSHQVNMVRGMTPSCVANRTNVCLRGHEFTPENTYVRPDGSRKWCRICQRARDAKRRAKRASARRADVPLEEQDAA